MAIKRILPGMSFMKSMELITDNNIKTRMLIVDIVMYLNENDMGPMGNYIDVLACFDGAGMYGADINTFYGIVCENDMKLFIALMKACHHNESSQVDCVILEQYLKSNGLKSVNIADIQKNAKEYLPNLKFFFCNSDLF